MKIKKELQAKERGITLIALVITIIILLILAGITIGLVTGDNGLLTQATRAKEETEKAQEKEQIVLAYNATETKKQRTEITADDLNDEFKADSVNAKAGDDAEGIKVTFEESGREYIINENGNITEGGSGIVTPPPATGATDGSWSDEKGVNTPVIKENMELVKWDDTQDIFVPDDTKSSYDYENNEWANAVVTIDGVESYFVWIPRYEYKINYNKPETPEDGGTIDINFIPTSQTTPTDGYTIHPAFTNDVENGGWNEELPGIWVGKYESSLVNKADSSNINTSNSSIGNIIVDSTNNIDKAIAVQPGMSSWRCCTIGNQYTSAKAYSESLNSHMLKNSEWGAVAYLTESKYGRNGTEVTINDNSDYITADVGVSENPEQSSTGNVYGIYDLSGGAWEYVAAYYNESSLLSYGNSFASTNGTSTEYATAYTGTTASSDYKTGDATYETSGWHGNHVEFVNSDVPFFNRGGCYSDSTIVGVFCFDITNGINYIVSSFRMCLAVK